MIEAFTVKVLVDSPPDSGTPGYVMRRLMTSQEYLRGATVALVFLDKDGHEFKTVIEGSVSDEMQDRIEEIKDSPTHDAA